MNLLRAGGWGPRVGVPSAPRVPPQTRSPPRHPAPGQNPNDDNDDDEEVVHASLPVPGGSMARPAIQGFQLPAFYHQTPGASGADSDADADDEGDAPPDWRPTGPPVERGRGCQGDQFVYQAEPPARLVPVNMGEDDDPTLNPWKTTLVRKSPGGAGTAAAAQQGGGDQAEQALIRSMLSGTNEDPLPKRRREPFRKGAAGGTVSPYFSDAGGSDGGERRAKRKRGDAASPHPMMYKEPIRGGVSGGVGMERGEESSTYETDAGAAKRRRCHRDREEDGGDGDDSGEECFGISGFTTTGEREAQEYAAQAEEEEEEEEERLAADRNLERLRALGDVRRASATPSQPPASRGGRSGARSGAQSGAQSGARSGGSSRSLLAASATKIHTDCCRDADGGALYDGETGEEIPAGDESLVWCFGCQWGAHNHRPVDKDKIDALATCFMNLILNASTTLENVGRIISNQYRKAIREPAAARGQWLPDWPPEVVQRHIENMIEPRVVNALTIRTHLSLMNQLARHTFRVDMRSGEEEVNLQAIRVWCAMTKEMRTLYTQVPKDSFGYNEMLRAESWSGGTLVHPTRIRAAPELGGEYAGAPALGENKLGGGRGAAIAEGGADTGDLRGPANDEELIRRPTGFGMGLPT